MNEYQYRIDQGPWCYTIASSLNGAYKRILSTLSTDTAGTIFIVNPDTDKTKEYKL